MTIAVDLGRKATKQTNKQTTHAHKEDRTLLDLESTSINTISALLLFEK